MADNPDKRSRCEGQRASPPARAAHAREDDGMRPGRRSLPSLDDAVSAAQRQTRRRTTQRDISTASAGGEISVCATVQ
jgi:hypothetical protein